MKNYIIQFPLKTEKWQEDILEKRFEIGRNMYNSLLKKLLKKYNEMIKRKDYRELQSKISETTISEEKRKLFDKLNQMRKDNGFSEYAFHNEIKDMQRYFKDNIDSFTAQKIATQLWHGFVDIFYGKGESVHFKNRESFSSLEGKSNKTGIRFMDNQLVWKGLIVDVGIDKKNHYEMESLKGSIAYCRILRKNIRSKEKYYLQIVFKGVAPTNIDRKTGEQKERIGSGEVIITLGKNILTYQKLDSDLKVVELADRVYPLELKRRELKTRLQGEKSGKLKKELQEIVRKQSAVRKYQHECLANEILKLGDIIKVQKVEDYQEWIYSIKREKRVKITPNSEVGNRAPSLFLTILRRKLKNYGKDIEVLT